MTIVGVIGGSSADAEALEHAETVGRLIAEAGATLVCGGMGGVMEAACRGAKSAGGTTIGILPGSSADEANPFVDIPIVTGEREARNVIIARTAAVLIAIDGGYGTLSEIAFGLHFGKTVVGLNSWSLREPVDLSASAEPGTGLVAAQTPAEAVKMALQAVA